MDRYREMADRFRAESDKATMPGSRNCREELLNIYRDWVNTARATESDPQFDRAEFFDMSFSDDTQALIVAHGFNRLVA